MPRFSICISVFNGERYLRACIDSVLNQSFSDYELIIVDDASSDGSAAILEKYAENDKRITVVRKSQNEGLHLGHRTAIEKCSGDYILFLDADDEKLIARYKSSRRRHPLCTDGSSIANGIEREREMLYDVRKQAHHVINTTDMMPAQLRSTIRALFAPGEERQGLQVTVYSFGFKHGAPVDADLVMDVRFLPNPYYDPELRPLTGLDKPVRDYVLCRSETEEFQKCWRALLDCVMPGYVAEGKQQLAIAVGCTGGQHRSVALAESTGEYLKQKGYRVSVAHRDLKLAEGVDGQLINASAKPVEGR